MSQELLDAVDDRRHSRTYRSEWIRQAIIARLLAEARGEWNDDIPDELTDDIREELEDGSVLA